MHRDFSSPVIDLFFESEIVASALFEVSTQTLFRMVCDGNHK
jgi:hypothetical protein